MPLSEFEAKLIEVLKKYQGYDFANYVERTNKRKGLTRGDLIDLGEDKALAQLKKLFAEQMLEIVGEIRKGGEYEPYSIEDDVRKAVQAELRKKIKDKYGL